MQGIIPSSDHYPVLLTLDMPTTLSVSSASVLPSSNLRYDNSRKESYVAQYIDGDGFFTELGRQLADVQELSAPEGIQLLQDCTMAAAQNTYQRPSQKATSLRTSLSLMMNVELPSGSTRTLYKMPLVM